MVPSCLAGLRLLKLNNNRNLGNRTGTALAESPHFTTFSRLDVSGCKMSRAVQARLEARFGKEAVNPTAS